MAELGDTSLMSSAAAASSQKSHELASCTIKAPQFSYAHLHLLSNKPHPPELDALQVRSYCSAALKQFLGTAGLAIAIDILRVEGTDCWLRIPHPDLAAFSAAVTAWQGTYEANQHVTLRIKACSDWLGSLLGQDGQDSLWSS